MMTRLIGPGMSNNSNQPNKPPKKMFDPFWKVVLIALILILGILFVSPLGPILWFMLTDNGRM
jgi:hypothetical protein